MKPKKIIVDLAASCVTRSGDLTRTGRESREPETPRLTGQYGGNSRRVLRCEECGAETETGEGWLSFLTVDNEAVVFCAECAEREFGSDPSKPLNETT